MNIVYSQHHLLTSRTYHLEGSLLTSSFLSLNSFSTLQLPIISPLLTSALSLALCRWTYWVASTRTSENLVSDNVSDSRPCLEPLSVALKLISQNKPRSTIMFLQFTTNVWWIFGSSTMVLKFHRNNFWKSPSYITETQVSPLWYPIDWYISYTDNSCKFLGSQKKINGFGEFQLCWNIELCPLCLKDLKHFISEWYKSI
jgi:hypothetical protein